MDDNNIQETQLCFGQFDECVDPFYNGLAAVYEYVDYDKYLGFINEQGELVIPYQYHCCHGAFPENQRPSLGHLK